jgi:hypothetical protein
MKTTSLAFSLAFFLCVSALAGVHGGASVGIHSGFGFRGGVGHRHGFQGGPRWSFGFGLALWDPFWCGWAGYWAGYPVYGYPCDPPVYSSGAALNSVLDARTVPAAAPAKEPEVKVWVPASPGIGKWVADTDPYRFTSSGITKEPKPAPALVPQTTTFTRSAGGVPVYTVSP